MRTFLCPLILLLLGAPVLGAGGPLTPEEAAKRFLEASRPVRQKIAGSDNPDPWLVVDALLAIGDRSAAGEFAGAAPRKDTEALPTYLSSEGEEKNGPRRAALAKAERALHTGDPEGALSAIRADLTKRKDILAVRALAVKGGALRDLVRYTESAAVFSQSAELAQSIGWLTRASEAWFQAGLSLYYHSDFPGAKACWAKRLPIEEALGSRQGTGRVVYNLALLEFEFGRVEDGEKGLARAVRLLDGTDDREYHAKVLWQLAGRAAVSGKLAAAIGQGEEVRRLLGAVPAVASAARFQADPFRVKLFLGEVVMVLAGWYAAAGHEAESRALLDEGIRIGKEIDEPSLAADAEKMLGAAQQEAGEHLDALARFERAAELYGSVGDRVGEADALRLAGGILAEIGDYASALEAQRKCIALFREIRTARELALALIEAGHAATQLGRSQEAAAHLDEALQVARKLRDRGLEASALGILGEHYLARARYGKSIETLIAAIELREGLPGEGTRSALRLSLGRAYEAMNDRERALEAYQRAEAGLERAGDWHRAAIARQGTAFLLAHEGKHEEAYRIFEELETLERRRANDAGIATAVLGKGDVRQLQGRTRDAVRHHRAALALYEKMGDARMVVIARARVGSDLLESRRPAPAMAEFEIALRSAEDARIPELEAWCCLDLGIACLMLGEPRKALDFARRGMKNIADLGMDLAEGEGARARSSLARIFEIGAIAAFAEKDHEALALFLEGGRAATLLHALGGRKALQEATVPPALLQAEEKVRSAEARAFAAFREAVALGKRKAVKKTRVELDQARDAVRDVIRRVQRQAKAAAAIVQPKGASLEEIQAALRPEEALILYSMLPGETIALVIRKAGVRSVSLGSSSEIRELCATLHWEGESGIRGAKVVSRPKAGAEHPTVVMTRLREIIADPLKLEAGVERVLVSPHGPLGYLPFSLLLPGKEIGYVPSGATLKLLRSERHGAGSKVLALGDPDYSRATSPTGSGGRVPSLPATSAEAKAVGDVVLLREKASETELRRALTGKARWRAVHLACHGYVFPEEPGRSCLVLTPDDENDGLLTAQEVFRLKIPADLVVLSACRTGRGGIVAGEGILGFTRSFMFAGSPRILVSLWEVPDDATKLLMVKFYDLLETGTRPALALAKAQEHVRSYPRFEDAWYWAAWALWGLPE